MDSFVIVKQKLTLQKSRTIRNMQAYVWTCGDASPSAVPLLTSQCTLLQAARQLLPRSAAAVSALCLRPHVVLLNVPSLRQGKVLFLGARGANVGDDISTLLSLAAHSLPAEECQASYQQFLLRLGVGKRLASARCSSVDAVFRIRIEQCAPTATQTSESDDETYEESSESSESSDSTELDDENAE